MLVCKVSLRCMSGVVIMNALTLPGTNSRLFQLFRRLLATLSIRVLCSQSQAGVIPIDLQDCFTLDSEIHVLDANTVIFNDRAVVNAVSLTLDRFAGDPVPMAVRRATAWMMLMLGIFIVIDQQYRSHRVLGLVRFSDGPRRRYSGTLSYTCFLRAVTGFLEGKRLRA